MADDSLMWADVRFDHEAAQAAAAECERAARLLREVAGHRQAEAHRALTGTSGPWRDRLGSEVARVEGRSLDIEARLRALAAALYTASTEARADQMRREASRLLRPDPGPPSVR